MQEQTEPVRLAEQMPSMLDLDMILKTKGIIINNYSPTVYFLYKAYNFS